MKLVGLFTVLMFSMILAALMSDGKHESFTRPEFTREVETAIAISQGHTVSVADYMQFDYVAHHSIGNGLILEAALQKRHLSISGIDALACQSYIVPPKR